MLYQRATAKASRIPAVGLADLSPSSHHTLNIIPHNRTEGAEIRIPLKRIY